jgi:hypothetical protein
MFEFATMFSILDGVVDPPIEILARLSGASNLATLACASGNPSAFFEKYALSVYLVSIRKFLSLAILSNTEVINSLALSS